MESSSRFRFRDHRDMENYVDSGSSSDISSVSSDRDNELEIESMTGKGIKHLCSELLELKAASDEDFHRNIFSNYSAFVRIFEEVKGMEDELMQLKGQLSTQKRLVKDLIDGTYLKVLSTETVESIIEESEFEELSPPSELEAHINNVLETLDIFMSENRIDEAIDMLEMEDENFQRIHVEDYCSSEVLVFYNSEISERKAMLKLQLTSVAENPRISAPELQKALSGLCRLGDNHLAAKLLLKYYHSRMATGIHNLQCSNSFLHGLYIRELAKFVFSMISQAAKSFAMLYGESSPYASELNQWACEETEVFVLSFNKYVQSISEISGGLSTAVEAVQFALSYCSLLEAQRLLLRSCLIKHIRPCMEEVLQIHIDHFKKVIGIFTTTDAWVLGRYLVSGSLIGGSSSVVVGQQPEYCLLTNSGRKFVTLLQAITEHVTPLVVLQMEGSILQGLVNLFMEYVHILERAITFETNFTEKGGPKINLAGSLQQQVSVLANLSTLEHFFSFIAQGISRGTSHNNTELMKNQSVVSQQKELGSCMQFIREASSQLRAHFFQQFIYRTMSLETGSRLAPETCTHNLGDPSIFHDAIPSVSFQVLFMELRKLDKFSEENIFEMDWLMELLRELIEAIFFWISNNIDTWATTKENLMVQHPDIFKQEQFVVDMNFLVEIALYGGYFSNNPLVLLSLMKSAFISAGLDPERDVIDDEWAEAAATEAIQRLLETEKANLLSNESGGNSEEEPLENHSETQSNSFQDEGIISSENYVVSGEDEVAIDASEDAINTETVIPNAKVSPHGGTLELLEMDHPVERIAVNLTDDSEELEDLRSDNAAYTEYHELLFTEKNNLTGSFLSEGTVRETSTVRAPIEEGAGTEPVESEVVINKLDDDAETEFLQTEFTSLEYPIKLRSPDDRNGVEMTTTVPMKFVDNDEKENHD